MNRATILHEGTPHRGPILRELPPRWGERTVEIQPEEVQVYTDAQGVRWVDIEVWTGESMGPVTGQPGRCGE